ncbi:MAG: NAD(P)-dependent oxidoreductase [Ignavibacteria bacterium]|nr:NAD(P)-dependent oxidoreductase [Ignavibacteria bacterium]
MKVAFLGTGLMGGLMAQRLINKNFSLVVWNRTIEKTEKLKSLGAKVAANPKEAINECKTIITMLSDYNAIIEVLFKDEISFTGKTVIQMSTISPGESILLKERVEYLGGEYLEAPVLAGVAQAGEGKLLPMVGSTVEQFEKWKPFLNNLGVTIQHMGEVGKGSAAKLACNQLIATMLTSFAMSVGYIRENNIDVEKFMTILRPSSYYASAFDKKLPNMINRDFLDTNFPLKHLLKDLNLVISEFESKGLSTKVLEPIKRILMEGIRKNFSEADYSALYGIIHPEK